MRLLTIVFQFGLIFSVALLGWGLIGALIAWHRMGGESPLSVLDGWLEDETDDA